MSEIGKKEKILDAAKKIFVKYGFSKTTLDDIGESVGIKKNSLYHYFKSKEDIFNAIINQEAENYFEILNKRLIAKSVGAEKLKIIAHHEIEYGKEKAILYNATVSAKIEISNIISDSYQVFTNKLVEKTKGILSEGIRNKEFIKHNFNQLANDLIDMMISIEQRDYRKSGAVYMNEINYGEQSRKIINLFNYIIKGLQVK